MKDLIMVKNDIGTKLTETKMSVVPGIFVSFFQAKKSQDVLFLFMHPC